MSALLMLLENPLNDCSAEIELSCDDFLALDEPYVEYNASDCSLRVRLTDSEYCPICTDADVMTVTTECVDGTATTTRTITATTIAHFETILRLMVLLLLPEPSLPPSPIWRSF